MTDKTDTHQRKFVPRPQRAELVGPPKPKGWHKRLPQQSSWRRLPGAKHFDPSAPFGDLRTVVPVSSVARDWGISARRVRKMLEEGRLLGRQQENGYWEVVYPYCYTFGTRGPQIKRQRELPESSHSKRKRVREQFAEHMDW